MRTTGTVAKYSSFTIYNVISIIFILYIVWIYDFAAVSYFNWLCYLKETEVTLSNVAETSSKKTNLDWQLFFLKPASVLLNVNSGYIPSIPSLSIFISPILFVHCNTKMYLNCFLTDIIILRRRNKFFFSSNVIYILLLKCLSVLWVLFSHHSVNMWIVLRLA